MILVKRKLRKDLQLGQCLPEPLFMGEPLGVLKIRGCRGELVLCDKEGRPARNICYCSQTDQSEKSFNYFQEEVKEQRRARVYYFILILELQLKEKVN